MMNKRVLILATLAVALLGGGALALSNKSNTSKQAITAQTPSEQEAMAMKKEQAEEAAMKKSENGEVMKKDGTPTAQTTGSYSDYDQAKLANAVEGKVVLNFSAPWCPICREADKNFNASATPNGLTLLKVDYDSANELKKKYGVTYQHTFVQVDKDGTLLKKWTRSTTYDDLQAEII